MEIVACRISPPAGPRLLFCVGLCTVTTLLLRTEKWPISFPPFILKKREHVSLKLQQANCERKTEEKEIEKQLEDVGPERCNTHRLMDFFLDSPLKAQLRPVVAAATLTQPTHAAQVQKEIFPATQHLSCYFTRDSECHLLV